jgi:hypothetical protein
VGTSSIGVLRFGMKVKIPEYVFESAFAFSHPFAKVLFTTQI